MIHAYRFHNFKRVWDVSQYEGTGIAFGSDGNDCKVTFQNTFDGAISLQCSTADFVSIDTTKSEITCDIPAGEFVLPAGEYMFFCELILPTRMIMLERTFAVVLISSEG
jgi:hypothetical protein